MPNTYPFTSAHFIPSMFHFPLDFIFSSSSSLFFLFLFIYLFFLSSSSSPSLLSYLFFCTYYFFFCPLIPLPPLLPPPSQTPLLLRFLSPYSSFYLSYFSSAVFLPFPFRHYGLQQLHRIYVCRCITVLYHSSVIRQLGCFQILAIVNNAAMNRVMQKAFLHCVLGFLVCLYINTYIMIYNIYIVTYNM